MPKRVTRVAAALSSAVAAVVVLMPVRVDAAVGVQQIEAYEDTSAPYTQYAAIEFGGSGTKTIVGGAFNGITFTALDALTTTLSNHASAVGGIIYGAGSIGNPYVTNVYSTAADPFFANTIKTQIGVATNGPVPGNFNSGAKVINNSYVAQETSNLDAQRRIDFMINRDDVTFVASATNVGPLANNYLPWSSFNALSVRGDLDGLAPAGSPGKKHADLGGPGHTSFSAATVAGYAVGLYGNAQSAGQTDAQHGVVMRSLLMAGAGKTIYTRQTVNNLDYQWGAGQPSYSTSLAMLQAGKQSLLGVSGGSVAGSITNNLKGWSYGTVNNGTQSAVIFHVANPINGLTASLNWNVNQMQPNAGMIDTTNAGVIFPDLELELRTVTFSAGQYVLGASPTDTTLKSDIADDNVEYLYSTSILPAGDYAFLITGDAARSPAVGFSYSVIAPLISQWASSTGGSWGNAAKWTNDIPNGITARANFLSSPGLSSAGSVTLDGNRTVGQITFDNTNSYSINAGSGGTLTIDDTGDGGGANPLITVSTGSHSINTAVSLVGGLSVNTAAGMSLGITGNVTGAGGVTKSGTGALTLSGNSNYGDTTVLAGTLTLASGASIASNLIVVVGGSTFNLTGSTSSVPTINIGGPSVVNFGGNTGAGNLARSAATINVGNGALVKVNTSAFAGNPVVLSANSIVFADATAKLNLTNNELLTFASLTSIRSRIASGQIFTSIVGANGGLGSLDLGGGQVEVRYTLLGDTNLDGKVDVTDLGNLASNYGDTSGKVWAQGDTDYNGNADIADLGNLASNYGSELALGPSNDGIATVASQVASTSDVTAVPEPATFISGALLASLATLRRRHRR